MIGTIDRHTAHRLGPERKGKRAEARAVGRLALFRSPTDDPAPELGDEKREDLFGAVKAGVVLMSAETN